MKTLKIALGVTVFVACALAASAQDAEQIRDCARNACQQFRSCTTSADGTRSIEKSKGPNTQVAVSDCRQDICADYATCVAGVPVSTRKPDANQNGHNAASKKARNVKAATITPKQ